MRILHVVWGMTRGGLESMLLDISRRQSISHRTHIIVVNAFYDEAILDSIGPAVTYHCVDRPTGSRNPWYWAKLLFEIMRFGPDIIHAHQISLIDILRFLRPLKVATVHDTRFEATRNIRLFSSVICISNAVRNEVLSRYPKIRRAIVIHNGVDIDAISAKKFSRGRPFRIVEVSRLVHEKKGQDLLLDAMKQLNSLMPAEEVELDFIGDGPSKPYLETRARELGIHRSIHFLGEVSRAEVYMRLPKYDLLVQPSRFEGFGLTVAEAMLAKVPVLVSDVEGPLEVVGGGLYGEVFRSEDPDDLARKIGLAISSSEEESTRMRVDRAFEFARDNFSIERTARVYIEEYNALKASSGS